ncbi:MAG: PD-(D/E)XK nuclease family protein [Prevotella sp.]|nr:PD-(D/E)XK nuclease family protein [Prevotella sp.]
MTKTFLEYVADDIVSKYGTDLASTAVVFPNKRASLFLNEHLARRAGKPLWSPAYITISDLFRQQSALSVGDPIKLVCDLHKSFIACTALDETLDRFYGWGQLLLADFDDIDKNMAEAEKVFVNLKNIHELDDVSYLDDEQKEILQRFFSNFAPDQDSRLKQKFMRLWSRFNDIYNDYRQRLRSQGIAYEGMLYRKVAENPQAVFNYDRYLFIGFNMMQKVEQQLCLRLMQEGKAKFYWDFDAYYMHGNEAGHYIAQYLKRFPNELDTTNDAIYNNFAKPKNIAYISAPTENIQARYVSHWLRQNNRIADGRRTAIILGNEGLLQTIIHCLPPEVEKVNITTGYPVQQSPLCSLVNHLINLQNIGFAKSHDKLRLRYVNAVLRHPYAQYISPAATQLADSLDQDHRYFPTTSELAVDQALAHVFTPVADIKGLSSWLLQIVKSIAVNVSKTSPAAIPQQGTNAAGLDTLMQESFFRIYTLLNRLDGLIASGDLIIDTITYQRLLTQLFQSATIPFHGEPAEGLQIMGVLETRNLDFDHVLLLSCNDGNIPRGINDSSFIPYSIRKAFGLTTIDNKTAIYAYYFHSLLQRAGDITILYNNSTEDGHTGEMSRFMLQMLVESPHNIVRQTLQAGQTPMLRHPKPIEKTPDVVSRINALSKLSPSAINRYLRCPLQFYYNYVAGIREPDFIEDDEIDNRTFGNIFHDACENMYKDIGAQKGIHLDVNKGARITIDAADIDNLLKQPHRIEQYVDNAFREHFFHLKSPSALPPLNGLQIINREVIISYIKQLLHIDRKLTPFAICGLEKPISTTIRVGEQNVKIVGTIDRLDLINGNTQNAVIRVVDYKTGHAPTKQPAAVADIFNPANIRGMHADYYLQAILYSLVVSHDLQPHDNLPVSPALLFIQQSQADDYNPTLLLDRKRIDNVEDLRAEFVEHLQSVLNDIFDPQTPFQPTADRSICALCPHRQLCQQ